MKRLFSAVGFLDVIHDILKHLRILDPEVIENIGHLFQHAVFSDPHNFLSIVRLPTAQICPLGGFPVLIDSFLGIGGDHLARGSTGQQAAEDEILAAITEWLFVVPQPHILAGFEQFPRDDGRISEETSAAVFAAVMHYDNFTEDNDPYGEHDFGKVVVEGQDFFWKIDYYDHTMNFGSENPADPKVTTRVLTIMLASEY